MSLGGPEAPGLALEVVLGKKGFSAGLGPRGSCPCPFMFPLQVGEHVHVRPRGLGCPRGHSYWCMLELADPEPVL